ncbi:hypothetical protein OTU49_017359, partial [Cherax quadricarinatus]
MGEDGHLGHRDATGDCQKDSPNSRSPAARPISTAGGAPQHPPDAGEGGGTECNCDGGLRGGMPGDSEPAGATPGSTQRFTGSGQGRHGQTARDERQRRG